VDYGVLRGAGPIYAFRGVGGRWGNPETIYLCPRVSYKKPCRDNPVSDSLEIVMFNLLDRLVGRCVAALLTLMFGYIAFTSVALALIAIFM
jgi:hypothetical protein